MNVSSIVVQVLPKNLDSVIDDLKNCEVCDYHFHDEKGRIIITIEAENVSEELKKLKVIEDIPNVISADMHMSYSENELDEQIKVLNNANAVPKVLDQDTTKIDPSSVVYGGDLRKKDIYAFAEKMNDDIK
ncbi:MAG: chaperone NapD [Sulfurospirillaceae bacterium]|nr:chaperone NapD [Sulfurospirillaceae bacterium]